MKLKFKADAFYNGELIFKAGEIYEVSEELGWAKRWLNRGAEEIVEPVKEIIETQKEPEQNKAVDVAPAKAKTRKGNKSSIEVEL